MRTAVQGAKRFVASYRRHFIELVQVSFVLVVSFASPTVMYADL